MEAAWIDRYLDRELTESENRWFEAYALNKADLIDCIEADTQLARAVRRRYRNAGETTSRLADASDFAVSAPTQIDRTKAFTPDSRSNLAARLRSASALRMVAAVLLGIGGGWVLQSAANKTAGSEVMLSPTRVIFDTLRGEGSGSRVEHADSGSLFVLVEAPVPPGAQQIVLKTTGTQAQTLSPAPDGFVSFLVERKSLAHLGKTAIEYTIGAEKKTVFIDIPSAMRGSSP